MEQHAWLGTMVGGGGGDRSLMGSVRRASDGVFRTAVEG